MYYIIHHDVLIALGYNAALDQRYSGYDCGCEPEVLILDLYLEPAYYP